MERLEARIRVLRLHSLRSVNLSLYHSPDWAYLFYVALVANAL